RRRVLTLRSAFCFHTPRVRLGRRGSKDLPGASVEPQNPVPFPTRFQEGSGAVARGVSVAKRRLPPRGAARTALPFTTQPIRWEQPPDSCAPKRLVRTVPRRNGRN